jgi:hypothetical protein
LNREGFRLSCDVPLIDTDLVRNVEVLLPSVEFSRYRYLSPAEDKQIKAWESSIVDPSEDEAN